MKISAPVSDNERLKASLRENIEGHSSKVMHGDCRWNKVGVEKMGGYVYKD